MKLIVKCPKCRKENRAPHHVNNRIDYAKQYGDNFSITCQFCQKPSAFHVDEIKAVDYSFSEIIKNRVIIFALILIISLILGMFITNTATAVIISVIITFISVILTKQNNASKNLTFNKHKLKGRVSTIGFRS